MANTRHPFIEKTGKEIEAAIREVLEKYRPLLVEHYTTTDPRPSPLSAAQSSLIACLANVLDQEILSLGKISPICASSICASLADTYNGAAEGFLVKAFADQGVTVMKLASKDVTPASFLILPGPKDPQ